MATILSGKVVRDHLQNELKEKIEKLETLPELAILSVGNNPESLVYIGQKKKMGEALGISVHDISLSENISEEKIIEEIEKLNKNEKIGGIIVQLPIPAHLNKQKILDSIDLKKDVDGLGSLQAGMLYKNSPEALMPATARGIMSLFDFYKINLSGKHVVVVGRSDLVGKPVALACLARNATATVCHSKTKNLKEITKTADVLIVACGVEKIITAEYVTSGQIVIDVGMHRTPNGLCGDVDFDSVSGIVSAITPVPGGVGPLTVISLFQNLLDTKNS